MIAQHTEGITLAEWQERIAGGFTGPPELEAILERPTHLRNETSRELRERLLPYFVHHAQMYEALKGVVAAVKLEKEGMSAGASLVAEQTLENINIILREIEGGKEETTK